MQSTLQIEEGLKSLAVIADALDKIDAPTAKDVRQFIKSTRQEIQDATDKVGKKIRSVKEKFGTQLLDFFLSENAPKKDVRVTNLNVDELTIDEEEVLREVMKLAGIKGMQGGSNCFRWLKTLVQSMVRREEHVKCEDLLGPSGNPASMHPWLARIGAKLRSTNFFRLVSVKDGVRRVGYTLRRVEK